MDLAYASWDFEGERSENSRRGSAGDNKGNDGQWQEESWPERDLRKQK